MAAAPENTREGFKLALQLGASGVESDVWLSADGIPVLDHDGRVGPRFRRRAIASLPYADLPDHVPSLGQLYDIVGPGYPISLDVKDETAFEPVIETARAAGPTAEANLWLCHRDLDRLTGWRSQTSARLVNSTRLSKVSGGSERLAAELRDRDIDGLSLFHREWSGGSIALLHRFERLALAWGAVHEREVAQVVDAGIDAVYSDHVDRMMAVITQYYPPTADR